MERPNCVMLLYACHLSEMRVEKQILQYLYKMYHFQWTHSCRYSWRIQQYWYSWHWHDNYGCHRWHTHWYLKRKKNMKYILQACVKNVNSCSQQGPNLLHYDLDSIDLNQPCIQLNTCSNSQFTWSVNLGSIKINL